MVRYKAGRLSKYVSEWFKITRDPVILSWLKGYKLPIKKQICQKTVIHKKKWSLSESSHISNEITHLLTIGAITECKPCKGQFISSIFLISKPNGKKRLILNLKELNKFLETIHFKMEDRTSVARTLFPNAYMANLDLKDAYFLIKVHNSHRKYLRFIFNDKIFEYTCIPFGLCSAPMVFTKLLKPVLHTLRIDSFMSVVYLDDFLLIGNTFIECVCNVKRTLHLLQKLGFVINYEKSNLIPQQFSKFLGFLYNTVDMTIGLPLEKQSEILKWINNILSKKSCTILYFSKFVGKIVAASPAIKYGKLYYKDFERAKYLALKISSGSYKATMKIPKFILHDLLWWKSKILTANNNIVLSHKYSLEIYTDASKSGWGAYCNNERASGQWSYLEKSLHINNLELLASYFGLKCFIKFLRDCDVLLHIDNTTAIAYINRMGGIKFPSLNMLTKKIWKFCEDRNIFIFATYIHSKENREADYESRRKSVDIEYKLSNTAFALICNRFGIPSIDLFASRHNKKCEKFISWQKDPDAFTTDAFTVPWNDKLSYAFPPFSLIPKVLQKIITDNARVILVIPYWPTQPWFPLFCKLLDGMPLYLKPQKDLLLSFNREPHPLWRTLTLAVGVLSNRDFEGEE